MGRSKIKTTNYYDKTWCINKDCDIKTCERHQYNLFPIVKDGIVLISFSNLEDTEYCCKITGRKGVDYMKGFIEITKYSSNKGEKCKVLIKVSNIEEVHEGNNKENPYIGMAGSGIHCEETYEEVKAMIAKAVE